MELTLDKFYPQKAELIKQINEAKTITKVLTKEDYLLVEKKRKEFKSIASNFKNTWKDLRAEATAFNKSVLAVEKELLSLVEPERDRLTILSEEYEKAQEREKRKAEIPARMEELKRIFAISYNAENIDLPPELSEDKLLELDQAWFALLLQDIKLDIIKRKQEEEDKKRKEEDRIRQENFRNRIKILSEYTNEIIDNVWELSEVDFFQLVEKFKIEKEESEKKKKKQEEEDKKRKEEERIKQDNFRNRIKLLAPYRVVYDDNILYNLDQKSFDELLEKSKEDFNKKEKIRIEELKREAIKKEEDRKKQEELEVKRKQKEEEEKIQKRKKYKEFLVINWYTEETKNNFFPENKWDRIILWEKKWEFIY